MIIAMLGECTCGSRLSVFENRVLRILDLRESGGKLQKTA